MVFQLHSGSLALRVRSREAAADIEVDTAEVRLRPERSGHYRIDRVDDTTQAGVWRGSLRVDDSEGFILEAGQRAELWRERRGLKFKWSSLSGDTFADWVQRDDQRDDQRSASNRFVSSEMTGAEDLDRSGRWERHPEYGAIWYPYEVRNDWAPYRYGRWAWVSPWGWTWVDEAPWGFAPFHYGRWVSWRGRWGWCPGDYVARPVYAPALVAWVGGPRVGLSINIGGPSIGWVPLAPREWYVPQHRYTPAYDGRVNPRPPGHRGDWQRPQAGASVTIRYGNQGVPGGVTVVPSDVLTRREPVGRHAADANEVQRNWGQQPAQVMTAPQRVGPPPPRVVSTVPADNRPATPPRGDRPDRDERNDRSDRGPRGERERERDRAPAPAMQVQTQPPVMQVPQPQQPSGQGQQQPTQPREQRPAQAVPQQAQQPQPSQPPRPMPPQPAPQIAPPPPVAAPARPAAPPAAVPPPTQQPAAQAASPAVGPPPPRRGPAAEERPRDDDRKRGPDNRGAGKDGKDTREQQR
jgi:hypothetical protein